MPERDLFPNFDRVRRDIDELFGDVVGRAGLGRRAAGFQPRVDVYYTGEPPRVVVKAELPGVEADAIDLEVAGRVLTISGHRRPAEEEGRVYQQLEIQHGPFRRVIELGADVRADEARASYDRGVLCVQLPVMTGEQRRRTVPIRAPEADGQ
jgi:HSP20 family protein